MLIVANMQQIQAKRLELLSILALITQNSYQPACFQKFALINKYAAKKNLSWMTIPNPVIRDQGKLAAEKICQYGDIAPACAFVEKDYFQVFKNRDYALANELTIKTCFLTLLYNDALPKVNALLTEGKQQALDYGRALAERHPRLRLKRFVALAVGFERACFVNADEFE